MVARVGGARGARKSLSAWAVHWPTEATGYGVVISLREALKKWACARESRASVQGFGNVAHYAIELSQRWEEK